MKVTRNQVAGRHFATLSNSVVVFISLIRHLNQLSRNGMCLMEISKLLRNIQREYGLLTGFFGHPCLFTDERRVENRLFEALVMPTRCLHTLLFIHSCRLEGKLFSSHKSHFRPCHSAKGLRSSRG